jgi:hypothetical protein
MFRFAPKSYATHRRRGPSEAPVEGAHRASRGSDQSNRARQVTWRTRSCASSPGASRALRTSDSTLRSTDDSTPFMTPRERRWRVSARVSISATPGMRCSRRWSWSAWVARQLEVAGDSSRTTYPSTCGATDSKSITFVPTFPISGPS